MLNQVVCACIALLLAGNLGAAQTGAETRAFNGGQPRGETGVEEPAAQDEPDMPAANPRTKAAGRSRFVLEEGSAGGGAADDPEGALVPALLSVAAVKQQVAGCQIGVKLKNRLPHKIGDFSLQFTAYLNDPNYVEPVPLETLTRSFYEVRPTDTQYLELFYMDARCAEFSFIGVNDTGRCSVGETNRFTTQKGGCERYLELATVNPIALHKGDRRPAKAGGAPPVAKPEIVASPIGRREVDQLVNRFVEAYELGNLERFLSLFDERVKTDEGEGLEPLRVQYGALFKSTSRRSLVAEDLVWKVVTPDQVQIQFRVKGDLGPNNLFGVERYLGSLDLAGTLRDGRLVITEYYQRKF